MPEVSDVRVAQLVESFGPGLLAVIVTPAGPCGGRTHTPGTPGTAPS